MNNISHMVAIAQSHRLDPTPQPVETPFPFPLVLGLAAVFFAFLLGIALQPDYGYFLDELYYIACAKRLDFGYVDHPPLAPALLALNLAVLGDSQLAIRVPPALCGAATIVMAGWVVWRLGGGRFSQFLSGLCIAAAPAYFNLFAFYSMNSFEIVFWMAMLCCLFQIGRGGNERLWWLVGGLVGLAVQNKHTSVVFAAALLIAVLVTSWRLLRKGTLWQGAALAVLIVLPNLFWQIEHDFVSLEFYAISDREGNVATSAWSVLSGQIELLNPFALPVWAAGMYFLLVSKDGQRDRLVGTLIAGVFIAFLISGKSRPDRIAGVYPFLFAAGAVQLESMFAHRWGRWLRVALPVTIGMMAAVVAPVSVPILPPDVIAPYMKSIAADDVVLQREIGTSALLLPLAHRRGSEELVELVARVFAGLDAAQQDQVVILATGYAPAGAIELLGGSELPPVYFVQNNGYLWGPPPIDPDLIIAVGFEPEQLTAYFENVDVIARAPCKYCMGWRQNMPIALASVARRSLREAWPELRSFGGSLRKRYLLRRAGLI